MPIEPDIVVAERSGGPVAVVVVKALNGDGRTASRYMRNLLVHGELPLARFVLFVNPQAGYLWTTPAEIVREAAPSLAFPMARIVEHYLPDALDSRPVRDLVLESIVRQWLADLADGIVVDADVARSLDEAGFLEPLRGGSVSARLPV